MTLCLRLMCTLALVLSTTGCLFVDIQHPMDKNYHDTELGSKVGSASSQAVLYLVAWGDSGSQAAASDGEITTIKHADRQVFSILFGLYTRITTVVYGD